MSDKEKLQKCLKEAGYILSRHGAGHDIYKNGTKEITVKRHDIDKRTLQYIMQQIQKNKGKR